MSDAAAIRRLLDELERGEEGDFRGALEAMLHEDPPAEVDRRIAGRARLRGDLARELERGEDADLSGAMRAIADEPPPEVDGAVLAAARAKVTGGGLRAIEAGAGVEVDGAARAKAAGGAARPRSGPRPAHRARRWLLGGAAGVAASVLIVAGLWSTGVVQIDVPGAGQAFKSIGRGGQVEMATGELTPEQMEELKRALAERDGDRGGGAPRPRKRRPASSGGAYVDFGAGPADGSGAEVAAGAKTGGGGGGSEVAAAGERASSENEAVRSNEGEAEQGGDLGAGAGGQGVPSTTLPSADVSNIPLPETGKLDDSLVRQVLNDGKRAVGACYTRELKANQGPRGRLEVKLTIEPTGVVSRSSIETPAFKGTALAECVAKKLKELRFPPFSGAARQYVVPVVLEKTAF